MSRRCRPGSCPFVDAWEYLQLMTPCAHPLDGFFRVQGRGRRGRSRRSRLPLGVPGRGYVGLGCGWLPWVSRYLCVYIRFCGNGYLGFRSYSGSLLEKRQSNQKRFAPPLGTSLRLGVPSPGIAPWAAAKGHPWPSAAIPASMPGCPLRNACVRPAWFNGAPRSRSRSKAKQSKAKQSKAKAGHV